MELYHNEYILINLSVSHQAIISLPLEILVGIERAWKKEVFSGPRPVLCAGMTTDNGAMAPGRAGARTLFSRSLSRTYRHR